VFEAISDRDDIRVAVLTATATCSPRAPDLKSRVEPVHEPGDYVRHNRAGGREFFYA